MLHHLAVATRIAGLSYRLLSTTTLIGLLALGLYEAVRQHRKNDV